MKICDKFILYDFSLNIFHHKSPVETQKLSGPCTHDFICGNEP